MIVDNEETGKALLEKGQLRPGSSEGRAWGAVSMDSLQLVGNGLRLLMYHAFQVYVSRLEILCIACRMHAAP